MNQIETIEYKGTVVPKFQAEGNAMQWVKPFAQRLCQGIGVEVGVNRVEWMAFGECYDDFVSEAIFKGRQKSEIDSEHIYTYFRKFATNYYPDEPNSFPIDPSLDSRFDATHFPTDCNNLDYIINSHVLEHLPNVVETLEYWKSALKDDGILFTYLPSYKSEYWKIQNNRKHLHEFEPKSLSYLLTDLGFKNVFVSDTDLNNSILAICNK
jgi:SAM-dependent methyltransferase